MAAHVVPMPDIGEGIAEVEIVAWHVQPGDEVREEQILADVMTDKASVEIPSPVAGRVIALGGVAGQVMAVGSELIRIETAGVPSQPAAAPAASTPAAAQPAVPAPPAIECDAPRVEPPAAAPAARRRVLAAPALRQRASDLHVDLAELRGSGPDGRVEHRDLDRWLLARAPSTAGAAAAESGVDSIPVIGLRRVIAERMQDAKQRIPHFSYVEELDVTELEALRGRLNDEHRDARPKLTLLPFIARALVRALADHPGLNARFDDAAGVVHRHRAVHIGIATQTDGGLMVPVLRDAQALDLWDTAAQIARLAAAARDGRASRADLQGSTITITSLGTLGGIVTTPVINAPEVAIVGVNRIVQRPVWRDSMVQPRLLMNLSSSFDHRVVDGLHAAQFVQSLKRLLECPALLFVV